MTIMGSRLSILPLSVWSKGMSLRPWLGKPEVRERADPARKRSSRSWAGSDLIGASMVPLRGAAIGPLISFSEPPSRLYLDTIRPHQ